MNAVELLASWFTPTVLFCVMNLMIGTIFFRSGSTLSRTKYQNKHQHSPRPEKHHHFDRPTSFLERVKSFKLSSSEIQQSDPVHHAVAAPAEELAVAAVLEPQAEEIHRETEEPQHHVARTKSDAVTKSAPLVRVLKKSASESVLMVMEEEEEEEEERRWPETARARPSGDGEVDGKADDFIIKFRKQLKLQRMDSLVRYNDMINRG